MKTLLTKLPTKNSTPPARPPPPQVYRPGSTKALPSKVTQRNFFKILLGEAYLSKKNKSKHEKDLGVL